MRRRVCRVVRRFGVVLVSIVLVACSGAPRRTPDPSSVLDVGAIAWTLEGRIAVSDGRDGGSGRIHWVQRADGFEIEIKAPVSRRTWRLEGDSTRVRLEGLEGGVRVGDSAEALLREHVGWSVPVADLTAWVRGEPPAGAVVSFDGEGRPHRLEQDGWSVEYRSWSTHSRPLPTKVFASRGDRRVRLLVDRWQGADGGR